MPSPLPALIARHTPAPIKRFVHHSPFFDRLAMRVYGGMLRRSSVTIQDGPLRGMKLSASRHTSHAHIRGTYERPVQDAIEKMVRPGDICYDLGASIGYMTLVMARKARHVYAFEPAPHAVAELARQIQANNLSNVSVIASPVSNDVRQVPFCLTDAAYGSAINYNESRWPILPLETITLDDFAARHPVPDFIKIDVEGEEHMVLEGARGILSQRKPSICCEIHSSEAAREVLAILRAIGYNVTLLNGAPFEHPSEVIPGEFHIIASAPALSRAAASGR